MVGRQNLQVYWEVYGLVEPIAHECKEGIDAQKRGLSLGIECVFGMFVYSVRGRSIQGPACRIIG